MSDKNFLESYDWFDIDLALYDLGVKLGLVKWDDFPTTSKWIVWSNNPTGNVLDDLLQGLVKLGYVEIRNSQARRIKYWKPPE